MVMEESYAYKVAVLNVVNIDSGFKSLMFQSNGIPGGPGGKFFRSRDINVITSKIVTIANKTRKISISTLLKSNRIR